MQAFDLRWGLRASKEGRDLEAGTPTRKPCHPIGVGSRYETALQGGFNASYEFLI
nr:MAG TPA: hypothetical protein [Caudoviricetes sp.]